MARSVTSFDVARAAGVSQPTASRALRNLPGASPATRTRVLAAAQELGYIPSESGRILSTRRTRRVAVVSAQLTNPYYPELLEPLKRELAQRGYRIVVVAEDTAGAVGLEALADGSYDGVVLTTTQRRSSLPRDLTERGIPHVLTNRTLDHPESSSVSADNHAGTRQVAALVAGLGHHRIAALHGPVSTSTGRERADALTRALRSHGIPLRRALTRRVEFAHDAGHAAALDVLDRPDRPTALVGGNDVIALGALSACRQLGLRVPEDVTVIGFDDIPMASWPLIGLTTVHVDLAGLAATAVDLLLASMEDPEVPPSVVRTPVRLVERGTHAALR